MGNGNFFVRMNFDGSDVKKITFGSISNRGARNYQEDSFGFSSIDKKDVKNHGFTAIVADGMGGLSNGDQISAYVVFAYLEMLKQRNTETPVHIYLSQSLKTVNNNVLASGIKGGSTMVAVTCLPGGIHWCTVGDSRVYLFRDGKLIVLNEDSDYMNDLIDRVISGDITFEEAGEDSKKDSLAKYIGYKGSISPDVNTKPLIPQNNDKLLLCSDGVYNALKPEELVESLGFDAFEAAQIIENKILTKGYSNQDNFTAVVLGFTR